MAPEVKSSDESSILTIAWRSLGLAETARLRRVTKRPAEGTGLLRKRKNKRQVNFTAVTPNNRKTKSLQAVQAFNSEAFTLSRIINNTIGSFWSVVATVAGSRWMH